MYADATSGKFLLCVTDWCFYYIEVGTYLYEHCNGVRLGLLASCDMQDAWWCWSVFCGFRFAVFHMVKACLECGKLCNISLFNIVMSLCVHIALIFSHFWNWEACTSLLPVVSSRSSISFHHCVTV